MHVFKKPSPWTVRSRTPAEDQEAMEEYIRNGGKTTILRDGTASRYNEYKEKNEKRLPGSFNPFSFEQSLTDSVK